MPRRLVNLLTALSLLLCFAVAAVWVRSLGHMDQVTFRPSDDLTVWLVYSACGQVLLTQERHKGFARPRTGNDFHSKHTELMDSDRRLFRVIAESHQRRFLGVGWTRPGPRDNPAMTFPTVLYSHLLAPAALLPAARAGAWLWKRGRRRRRRGPLRRVRLRPPRHAGAVPRMRDARPAGSGGIVTVVASIPDWLPVQ